MVLPGLEHPLLALHVILTQQLFLEEAKKANFVKISKCSCSLTLISRYKPQLCPPLTLCFITWGFEMKHLRPFPPNPSPEAQCGSTLGT